MIVVVSDVGEAIRDSMRNGLGELAAGTGRLDRITSTVHRHTPTTKGSNNARTAVLSDRSPRNAINRLIDLKVTHNIIRHHPNRHNPSLECLGTLTKSLSFQ